MSLAILNAPSDNSSVTNEMLFVINESVKAIDPVTYPNYKYVLDIYISGVLKARLKSTPDPTYYYGVFNVSTILRNFVEYEFVVDPTPNATNNPAKIAYQVKLGEEYGDTTYTNLVEDSTDREAFKSYSVRPFDSSIVVTDANWATNMPDVISANRSLKWLFVNYYEDSYPSNLCKVLVNTYQEDDTLVGSNVFYLGTATGKNFLQINGSPEKAIATAGGLPVSYYTVNVSGNTKRVNLMCDGKYPLVTLAWLNQFGAYESFGFGLVSKKDIEVSRKEYSQLPYRINASGVPSYSENNVFYGSKRGFASNVMTKLRLTSHLLTKEEYEWLSELFASTDVYMYSTELQKFFPVSVKENGYEFRTFLNSRLKPLEFTVEFSDQYNGQFL